MLQTKTRTKLATQLQAAQPKLRVIYISTYIPRECGIATFTKDLTNAINLLNPLYLADIVAIDDEKSGGEHKDYPWEVKYKIEQENLRSWLDAATYINQSGADVVVLEHEFGIYGGNGGEYAVPFVEAIKKPVVITFHTVLPNPEVRKKEMVYRLAKSASAIIVMVKTAVDRLVEDYDIPRDKIVVIPHGVPDISFGPTDLSKKALGYKNYNLIGSFGLIGPGKGYEHAIAAMPHILKSHPKTKLLILGETHPVVKRNEGEKYRNMLKRQIKRLKIEKNVEFVNRYLGIEEIVSYLKATDIYITPFLGMNQITSGTLSYAIGAGKVCVSTPYFYAQDILSNERGLLVEPANSKDLAEKVTHLFNHPRVMNRLARRAYDLGRSMIWPSVALQHLDLFRIITGRNYNDC